LPRSRRAATIVSIKEIVDTMATENKRRRRNHSAQLKEQILAECAKPGASVAQVAMAHGINANILHGWRKRAREAQGARGCAVASFIPVVIPSEPAKPPREEELEDISVHIELHRAGLVLKLSWPLSAVDRLPAFARELLR
jgi:transposase